jgi:hypothetical protein
MRRVEGKRAVVLGEFGGLGMPVAGHTWQDERNWGYVSYKTPEELTDAYINLLKALRPLITEGLSAAVYTQTTDVEIEVNGLLTYDRKLVKLDQERIVAAARELYGPPPAVATVLPTSQDQRQTWRFTTAQPTDDWFADGYNDESWQTGPGGFGTEGTPGAVIGTEWKTRDIWLRRSFDLKEVPKGDLFAKMHHDEDAELYLNGQLVAKRRGYRDGYGIIPLDARRPPALRVGKNSIAVHCRQTRGGQFVDVGLVVVGEPPPKSARAALKP